MTPICNLQFAICNLQFGSIVTDPTWPWSLPTLGTPSFLIVATVLIGLTIWTYRGVRNANPGRVVAVLGLRLLALLLAFLAVLRPSFASRGDLRQPSVLLILSDKSESMTIRDAFDQKSRWEEQLAILRKCEPILRDLREDQNVTVVPFRFAEDIGEFDPQGKPDGKRTDFGQMLNSLYERYKQERRLRGLVILSDGADNGTRYPALTEAAKFRGLPCPIYTFALGQITTTSKQRDIGFTAIVPEPSPVSAKGKLTVKGVLDAPGFEGTPVHVKLFIGDADGEPVADQELRLEKTTGNEIKLTTDAPATAGEIRVTLKVDKVDGEVVLANNEISTYVTVNKEGLSVLYVAGQLRWEQAFIRRVLAQDPRIRLYEAVRETDESPPDQADLFEFDKRHYDVIILGDLTAKRLSGNKPTVLTRIADEVRKKGAGLMMMGGFRTFGNGGWQGTPIAEVLPVHLNAAGQIDDGVRMLPTVEGLEHYLLRLSPKPAENAQLWRALPPLEGMTHMGKPKDNARIFARANDAKNGAPMLVALEAVGAGRTIAFAADTTWQWVNLGQPGQPDSNQGLSAHARFWKQLVLWLAKQEEAAGNLWVRPDTRRLPAGSRLGFSVGLQGKGGGKVADARFEVKVIGPADTERKSPGPEYSVPSAFEKAQEEERGTFWKTDSPGEYQVVVRGSGTDTDGQPIRPEPVKARFLVYQDDAEMLRQAADHDFLAKLANAGGGKSFRADQLPQFLKDLGTQPLPNSRPRLELAPDWRRNALSGFLVTFFLLFVGVLCLEWGLRRYWGMV